MNIKYRETKNRMRKLSLCMTSLVICQCIFAVNAAAYFNRGTVSLELSQASVSVKSGETLSVSVSIDPIKEDQLPGCGMAECPQSCGNTGCLNENGECTCGGTTYQTYYSSVSVSSSNADVASASYANGVIVIKGTSPGTAVLTVTGTMRQYTSTEKKLDVVVTGNSQQAAGSDSEDSEKSNDSQEGTDEIKVTELSESAIETEAEEEDINNPEGVLRDTKRGKYRIVQVSGSTDVKKCFDDAIGEGSHLVFQHKSGENVDWSWTFDGAQADKKADFDIDLDIEVVDSYPEAVSDKLKGKNVFYMSFLHDGTLPSEAEIYINVADTFKDGDVYLYHINSTDGTIEQLDEKVTVENGYATFKINHCSDYFISDSEAGVFDAEKAADKTAVQNDSGSNRQGGSNTVLIIVLLAGVVAIISAVVIVKRKKGKTRDGGDVK